jgi:hypothetical protein
MMGRRVWRYPAEHVEKLTALCAEKLAAQRDAAARAAERAARRAAKKLVKAARRDREAAKSAARISPE